jgi:hypothetical protein
MIVPPKRPPILATLWDLRPNPAVVLVLLMKPDRLKIPVPLSVARSNNPGILAGLRSLEALFSVPNMGLFRLSETTLAWLLRDVFSVLLNGVGVSIRVWGAGVLCLSGVVGLPTTSEVIGVSREEVLGGVDELFVWTASRQ